MRIDGENRGKGLNLGLELANLLREPGLGFWVA